MSRITLSPRLAPAEDTGLRLDLRRIHPEIGRAHV